ncbi:uncharacterized protein [Musca autumnalis]|uniref:uncharacterized protein n=1 Tax=Musca autumnalis TaxID=221902 RepID=UPI003CF55673
MDLYNEKEEIISSDEYEYSDDDALMNDAIRAQSKVINSHSQVNEKPWGFDQKQKQLSSLIRRNKISVIYKNKSIKWLNSKKHRERYKRHIARNASEINQSNKLGETKCEISLNVRDEEADNIEIYDEDSDNENCVDIGKNLIDEQAKTIYAPAALSEKVLNGKETGKTTGNTDTTNEVLNKKRVLNQSSQTDFPEKRARPSSPLGNESKEEHQCHEKRYKPDGSELYKHINEMFPTFNEIAKAHIDHITNNSIISIENKMKSIFQEIQTLNEILQTKEMEWNRILHLKIVKEELYSRLSRKKTAVEMSESLTKSRSQNALLELKELESYLSENTTTSSATNSSIQQIIEKRANMKPEDLEREKNNTSRLHRLLVSRNMLPDIETADMNPNANGEVNVKPNVGAFQNLQCRNILNRGRQGEFKDVKSIITDFREKNSDVLIQDKQNQQYINFMKDYNSSNYIDRESLLETSFAKTGGVGKELINPEIAFSHNLRNNFNTYLDGNTNMKEHDKRTKNSPKNMQYPYCQECKIHESRFVCAGCGNQWYCSKKCQISAWDRHSEICTD